MAGRGRRMLAAFATEGAVASQDLSGKPGEPAQAGAWRFGAAVLDEQSAELRVAGARMDLDRSSYDVLLALLRHAGEVVTKDELLEAGWPRPSAACARRSARTPKCCARSMVTAIAWPVP